MHSNSSFSEDFNRETDTEVYFFTPRFYALDNFSAYTVDIWERKFLTSEHAYQWKKYSYYYPEIAMEVLHASSAYAAKKIADQHKQEVRPEWHNEKAAVMEEILRAKTQQHEKVRETLLETRNKNIVENNPDDGFWGIGSGNGQNTLGKIWMKLRDELSAND